MLDFEISKKLNIKAYKIDLDKSYYSFNPNTCYLTIELYLKKMLTQFVQSVVQENYMLEGVNYLLLKLHMLKLIM